MSISNLMNGNWWKTKAENALQPKPEGNTDPTTVEGALLVVNSKLRLNPEQQKAVREYLAGGGPIVEPLRLSQAIHLAEKNRFDIIEDWNVEYRKRPQFTSQRQSLARFEAAPNKSPEVENTLLGSPMDSQKTSLRSREHIGFDKDHKPEFFAEHTALLPDPSHSQQWRDEEEPSKNYIFKDGSSVKHGYASEDLSTDAGAVEDELHAYWSPEPQATQHIANTSQQPKKPKIDDSLYNELIPGTIE